MVFYMPGPGGPKQPLESATPDQTLDDLTPSRVVAALDRFIVGQPEAKRAVAVALRNRWRRRQLPAAMADEVLPKNILMIGPTGVGKTEIARRLARLTGSPFLKVEATKYTEVGYVGRDCESMVRDLLELTLEQVRRDRRRDVAAAAARAVEDRLLALLGEAQLHGAGDGRDRLEAREELRRKLRDGELEDRPVEIETEENGPAFKIAGGPGGEELDIRIGEMMPGMFGRRTRKRKVTVSDARVILQQQEEDLRLEKDDLAKEAIRRVEQNGILFIDEMDKVAGPASQQGPDVSRQGVQRDLLPIIEGTIVQTKHGPVRTDHILFIAAGAFHVAKPSDLMPELQGRLPIRVELSSLSEADFVRILTEPENSLVRQYQALLGVDGVQLEFTQEAVASIARMAARVNETAENIGARRLITVLEKLLESCLFDAPDRLTGSVRIEAGDVETRLGELVRSQDLARYVL